MCVSYELYASRAALEAILIPEEELYKIDHFFEGNNAAHARLVQQQQRTSSEDKPRPQRTACSKTELAFHPSPRR